ncbi:MAG TPA: DUF2513 domain-containing protein [Epsilonproteobacteria bacterium]|nr:DUF2513 domain-containing protein [Campylobacterota bacterium]
MTRDWEVIRVILSKVEENSNNFNFCDTLEEEQKEQYVYHVELLIEAGMIKGKMKTYMSGEKDCNLDRLTWKGHDFLDAIRSDSIWDKTKNILKEKGLGMSFEIIKKTAIKFAEEII